jgi:hypothetical protein
LSSTRTGLMSSLVGWEGFTAGIASTLERCLTVADILAGVRA